MTVKEMHVGVNLQLQEIASFKYDDFLPQEVDYYLNKAITRFVDKQKSILRTETNSPKSTNAWENLRTLIQEYTFVSNDLSQASGFKEAVEGSLSNLSPEYLHYLSSRTKLPSGEWINNRLTKSERFIDYAHQKTNIPFHEEFPILVTNNKIVVIPSDSEAGTFGNSGTKIWIMYLTSPARVDIENGDNSDLPSHTHEDIVDMTVRIMNRDLGSNPSRNDS